MEVTTIGKAYVRKNQQFIDFEKNQAVEDAGRPPKISPMGGTRDS